MKNGSNLLTVNAAQRDQIAHNSGLHILPLNRVYLHGRVLTLTRFAQIDSVDLLNDPDHGPYLLIGRINHFPRMRSRVDRGIGDPSKATIRWNVLCIDRHLVVRRCLVLNIPGCGFVTTAAVNNHYNSLLTTDALNAAVLANDAKLAAAVDKNMAIAVSENPEADPGYFPSDAEIQAAIDTLGAKDRKRFNQKRSALEQQRKAQRSRDLDDVQQHGTLWQAVLAAPHFIL